jgi:hypothetical protein
MACQKRWYGHLHDGPLEGLESEKTRLKKMNFEERLKAEIMTESLAKKW